MAYKRASNCLKIILVVSCFLEKRTRWERRLLLLSVEGTAPKLSIPQDWGQKGLWQKELCLNQTSHELQELDYWLSQMTTETSRTVPGVPGSPVFWLLPHSHFCQTFSFLPYPHPLSLFQTPTKYQGRSTQHSVTTYMVTGSEAEQTYVWIIEQILYSQKTTTL